MSFVFHGYANKLFCSELDETVDTPSLVWTLNMKPQPAAHELSLVGRLETGGNSWLCPRPTKIDIPAPEKLTNQDEILFV